VTVTRKHTIATGKLSYRLLLIVALQLSLSRNACAYLDPGTGSYVFQVLVAAVIGGLFAIKMFWQRIKHFFGNLFSKR
jgi:hypothetical protein